jgi:hypothetical protein
MQNKFYIFYWKINRDSTKERIMLKASALAEVMEIVQKIKSEAFGRIDIKKFNNENSLYENYSSIL